MSNLKAEWNWGTGRGKVHIVPASDTKWSFSTARCGIRQVEGWGTTDPEHTLEWVRNTGFGLCAKCAHYVIDSVE